MNKGLSKQGTGCRQNDSELIRCTKGTGGSEGIGGKIHFSNRRRDLKYIFSLKHLCGSVTVKYYYIYYN